jgi:hypothetical protein
MIVIGDMGMIGMMGGTLGVEGEVISGEWD